MYKMHARMQTHTGIPERIEMIKIRKAVISEAGEILSFYENIIFSLKNSEFNPKWNESYPDIEFINYSILKGEMYVYSQNGLKACLVINNELGKEYNNVKWHVNANPDEIIAIHTFAVKSMKKGIGKGILDYIMKEAIKNNKKTIRVDVIDGNIGAQRAFEKWGFEYVDSVEMFHEAVGWETFHLFERILNE